MTQATDLNIDHLAKLARLALTPEEKARFAAQLGDILSYVERLKEVTVDGIEPTAHAMPLFNVWREDEPGQSLTVEQALRNAPARTESAFLVPTVVE